MQEDQNNKPERKPEHEHEHEHDQDATHDDDQQTQQNADAQPLDDQPNDSGEALDSVNTQQDAQNADGEAPSYDELEQQLEAMTTQVLRERADKDNLRKRQERELQNAYKFATEKLIKDMLPVIDSLALGIESAQKNDQSDALDQFISGSEMTLKLLTDTLTRHGVVEINPDGEKFDPERHEAISMSPNPNMAPNTIMHVAQKGYELNGRVIRAAQVVVCKAPE